MNDNMTERQEKAAYVIAMILIGLKFAGLVGGLWYLVDRLF